MRVVLVTGGFDPLHSGHLKYFKDAAALGDVLVVGLNSDDWLTRKKGRPFMPFEERYAIINSIKGVDMVLKFNDTDNSARDAINQVKSLYPESKVIFANGGDRNKTNIPEMDVADVIFKFGVGGENKANSSSWILDAWKTQKTERDWGYWRVLDDKPEQGYKLKELVINPGGYLSDQKHLYRSEYWYVLNGICTMDTEYNGRADRVNLQPLTAGYLIKPEVWHRASNNTAFPCHILEVQFGTKCEEEDIIRRK